MPPKAAQGTLPLGSRPTMLTVDGFTVEVIEGPDKGKSARATTREAGVGTAQGNELVLTDPTVSRHHLSVTSTKSGVVIRDLGSTNGSRVGAVRVHAGTIDDGATIEIGRTKLRVRQLDEPIIEPLAVEDSFESVLGQSAAMRRLFALLPRIAASESTVLLEGETGTGKGRLADAIHSASPRSKGPLVVLDCSSIPESLVESELFGHEKGSFTGAFGEREGAFEQAAGGTIFLDEIGELPLDMQPKLLRALEDRTVKRVGGNRPIKLDVRIIAATNRDLRGEVNRGTFRSDLYFRLNVVRLLVPPLRERREDIPILIRHFYQQLAPGHEPSPELVDLLLRQSWPGNVRELRSSIERAVLFGGTDPTLDLARLDDVPAESPPPPAPPSVPASADANEASAPSGPRVARDEPFDPAEGFRAAKDRAISAWEARYLERLVAHVHGNLSEAARLASMDRTHLRDLLKKYGLRG
ncbi:MAG: sigma 54-interacting transcriptional regulator [Polyangiaceae bacterium]